MSHAKKVMKAIKIMMMLNRLSKAKENAMRDFLGLPPRTSWFTECQTKLMTCVKDKCCQIFMPCCIYDRNRLKKRPSCWGSPTFKEFFGFIGGIILTIVMYLIMIYQLDVSPKLSALSSASTGFVITMLMSFSENIRCLVLLMLPQLFSGKGRMLLLMYALFLAINHPLRNINANITVMSQSTTCGQEMAMNETKQVIKAAVAPMESIMDSIEAVIRKLTAFSNSLRATYSQLKTTVSEIGSTIKTVAKWLGSMVDRCNEKMGSPYRSCKKVFNKVLSDCRGLWFVPGFMCDIVGKLRAVCDIVRIGELLCFIAEAISKLLKSSFDAPVQSVLDSAKDMFYFNVSINYHFNYSVTQSKSYKQVKEDISKDIHTNVDTFVNAIGIFKNVMVITLVFVLVKALLYKRRWMSEDRYDNIYITFTVRDLDERRTERGKPGILPLNYDEECQYLTSMSARMINKEKRKLAFGLVLFIISFFNAAFYLFCDYGLYSALALVAKHFSLASKAPVPPHTKLNIVGKGPMSDMYRSIVGMFDPMSETNIKVDVSPCVPHPSEPDWNIYKEIGIIYFICLILTILEAYGLRTRHQIMNCYFPKRERRRAIWLYNHILKLRGGIMLNARRNMKKKHSGEIAHDHISLKGRLAASFPILERLFKCLGWEVKSCLYCGREGKPDNYLNFVHCQYFDCDAVYCVDCYADLDNICAVCENAVEITGSDHSEEEDSSVDERQNLISNAQRVVRQKRIETIKAERKPSRLMEDVRAEWGIPLGRGKNKSSKDIAKNSVIKRRNVETKPPKTHSNANKSYKNTNNSSAVTIEEISGRRKSSNKNFNANAQPFSTSDEVNEYLSSSESDVSSCSSIDTDDLDFGYQYEKVLRLSECHQSQDFDDDDSTNVKRYQLDKLELVTQDIFSSTDSDSDSMNSDSDYLAEPQSLVISRS